LNHIGVVGVNWTLGLALRIQGGPKKTHKVNDTIILQPYVIES